MRTLALITARGGSKGIPGKNTKLLGGKPLLHYTIEAARSVFDDADICLSTDADYIIECAQEIGLEVPFKRPDDLATDTATSNSVIRHALDFYNTKLNREYDALLLLQPTSPFRKKAHIEAALSAFKDDTGMLIGVKETDSNPYTLLYEEEEGILKKVKEGTFTRRQDCPTVWEVNGAIYLINLEKYKAVESFAELSKTKVVMDKISSIDLDTPLDWELAELIVSKKMNS